MLSNSLAALRCLQTHSDKSNQCSRQWLVLNSCRLCCHPAWDSRQLLLPPLLLSAGRVSVVPNTPVEATRGHEARATCCYGAGSCISKASNGALLLLLIILALLFAAIDLWFLLLRLLA